jgi:hypothetical protein
VFPDNYELNVDILFSGNQALKGRCLFVRYILRFDFKFYRSTTLLF